jgi:hypothetical protein
MHWLLWIIVSNLSIAVIEYSYRAAKFATFAQAVPWLLIPILIGQAGLFYGFRGAPNLLFAGAVFTLINISFRIANSYMLGEAPNVVNWMGVALLVIATICLKYK